jgi:hypothetical protein
MASEEKTGNRNEGHPSAEMEIRDYVIGLIKETYSRRSDSPRWRLPVSSTSKI